MDTQLTEAGQAESFTVFSIIITFLVTAFGIYELVETGRLLGTLHTSGLGKQGTTPPRWQTWPIQLQI